jgi:hypothetical protein
LSSFISSRSPSERKGGRERASERERFVNVHVCVHALVFLVFLLFTLHECLCARACIHEACINVKQ